MDDNMRAVILAPWRDGGGADRKVLWDFCKKWWADTMPDLEIFEGAGPGGGFNRSAAINEAAAKAGDWDVAVIIDTDIIANAGAVRNAIDLAVQTDQMVVSHDERIMLTKAGTQKILGGFRGNWRTGGMQERVWADSVSCCVITSRKLWDLVGGFDEAFVSWGYEDTAWRIAAETLSGKPMIRLSSELFHMFHAVAPGAQRNTPTFKANGVRVQRYRDARWNVDEVRGLLEESRLLVNGEPLPPTRIPRIIHRTVPAETSDEVEGYWREIRRLHPGWELRTHREPIDPAAYPLTGAMFDKCQNGAQKAGLIRLEQVYWHGGAYLDSDVRAWRSLEPLLHNSAVAAWEDETTVPDAVFMAEKEHPAVKEMIDKAVAIIKQGGDAWASGPGVFTSTLPDRTDFLLLPPGAFYPHHYLEKAKAGAGEHAPWCYVEHLWHHSWGSDQSKADIAKRQRV